MVEIVFEQNYLFLKTSGLTNPIQSNPSNFDYPNTLKITKRYLFLFADE